MEHYCLEVPLSSGAFKVLQEITVRASQNLEKIDKHCRKQLNSLRDRAVLVILLAQYTLEELACPETIPHLCKDFLSAAQ